LCPQDQGALAAFACNTIEAGTAFVGAVAGFIGGGGAGFVAALPTGELASPLTVPAGAVVGEAAGGAAGALAGKAITNVLFSQGTSGAGKMQREVERGHAPNGVDRVDRGNPSDPGDAEPHVHLDDGRALTQSGRWKHGAGEVTKSIADWLKGHGWSTPGGNE